MTETTSIDRVIRERRVYSPVVVRRPNVTTVMAQTAVGYIAANFLLILARVLLVPERYNFAYVFALPMVLVFAVGVGVTIGLFIWAGFEMAGTTLNVASRSIIGAMMIALACLATMLVFGWPLPPPEEQPWALAVILAPGIGIGVVTGSRLRVWHELVRRGDPVGRVLGVFAAVTGVILRLLVVNSFITSPIALVGILQSEGPQEIHWHWWALMCAHFTAGTVLLFARMKTEMLLPLAVIVNAPVVAVSLTFPELRYAAIAYLALWAVFLLTRWRQTPVALSFLKEEFRYYLID